MKNKIIEVDGKFYLMDFSNKSFIEVSDYKSPKDGILTPFSCIMDRKEYTFCNETMLEKPRDFDPFGQTGFAHLWLQYD